MEALRCRLLRLAERTSWTLGLGGLVWWGSFQIGVNTGAQHDLERFAALTVVARQAATLDQSLWSQVRVSAWRKALSEPSSAPIAVLRIPKIGLEVSVLEGTDDLTLDRAVGHIEGTAHEDVWVLDPTSRRALTLVTCYPFYFIGSAPQRFIVRAVRIDDKQVPSLRSFRFFHLS